jgi:hypothetical protein
LIVNQRGRAVNPRYSLQEPVAMSVPARLRCYEQKALHVSQRPREIVAEFGKVAVPKSASKFDRECKR